MYHILSDYDLRTIFFLLFSYIEISIMSQEIPFDKEEKEDIMTQHSEDNSKTASTVPRLIRRPDSDSISLCSDTSSNRYNPMFNINPNSGHSKPIPHRFASNEWSKDSLRNTANIGYIRGHCFVNRPL